MSVHVIVMCEPGRRGDAAIAEAASLVHRHAARLTLAAVLDLPSRARGCLPWSAWRDLMIGEARSELDRVAARLGGDAGRVVIVGPAAALGRLEALECDLLVLPARRRFTRDPYASLRRPAGRLSFPVAEARPEHRGLSVTR